MSEPKQKTKTPELEKLNRVSPDARTISEFLYYLEKEHVVLAEYDRNERLFRVQISNEEILAGYFNISLGKCERERQALLKEMRNE